MLTLSADIAAMAAAARNAALAFASLFEQTARALLDLLECALKITRTEMLYLAAERAGVPASDVRRFFRSGDGWVVVTWNRRTIDLTPYMQEQR